MFAEVFLSDSAFNNQPAWETKHKAKKSNDSIMIKLQEAYRLLYSAKYKI